MKLPETTLPVVAHPVVPPIDTPAEVLPPMVLPEPMPPMVLPEAPRRC